MTFLLSFNQKLLVICVVLALMSGAKYSADTQGKTLLQQHTV